MDRETHRMFQEFQLQLILANREYCKRGLRNVIQKRVFGSTRSYQIFDGEKWIETPIRMNSRQISEQKRGVLSGCVENC